MEKKIEKSNLLSGVQAVGSTNAILTGKEASVHGACSASVGFMHLRIELF